MKRRKLLSLIGIAAIAPKVLAKPLKEKPIYLSPTHLIKLQSKESPERYAQFPCVLESCKSNSTGNVLTIGENLEMTYRNGKQEKYVITEIEKLKFGAYVEITS